VGVPRHLHERPEQLRLRHCRGCARGVCCCGFTRGAELKP
jgi:hypothetical protein